MANGLKPAHATAIGFPPVLKPARSEEHTSELQSLRHLVCRHLQLPAFPTRRSSDLARVRGLLCKSELLALQVLDFFDPRTWIGDDLHLIAVAVVCMGHHGERFETGACNGDRVPTCIEACQIGRAHV